MTPPSSHPSVSQQPNPWRSQWAGEGDAVCRRGVPGSERTWEGGEGILGTNQHRPNPHLVLVCHPPAGSGRTQRSGKGVSALWFHEVATNA